MQLAELLRPLPAHTRSLYRALAQILLQDPPPEVQKHAIQVLLPAQDAQNGFLHF